MEIVKDVKSFVEKNGDQLLKFFVYKTGIIDRELVHEHLQEFYVKMIQTNALERYQEEKGSFDTYISTLLCWLMPQMARKNINVQHEFVSQVKFSHKGNIDVCDIWEHTSKNNGPYRIDFSPCTPRVIDDDEENDFSLYLDNFKEYIVRTESKKCSFQMLTFLDKKAEGCNSSDIAIVLGVSDNLVKFIKQKLQGKFEIWKIMN